MNPVSKTSKSDHFKVLLCIAAYLPMMFGGAGAFVLCFGDGGHLASEFAHEGGHDHSANHLEGSDVEHHGSIFDDCCNTCFDIPLTIDHADPYTVKKCDNRTVILLVKESTQTASCSANRTDENIAFISRRPPPPLLHSLEGLSTIVLRT
jgi:hypothetical protein